MTDLGPRQRALVAAWCAATGRDPLTLSPEDLDALDTWAPLAGRAARNRRRALGEPRPAPPVVRAFHDTPDRLNLTDTLAALPRSGLQGFRGRRDGFVVALVAVAALTRHQVHTLRCTDLHLTGDDRVPVTVHGIPLARAAPETTHIPAPPASPPPLASTAATRPSPAPLPDRTTAARCPACAVTRWLRVLGRLDRGRGAVLAELNDPAALPRHGHDCIRPVPDDWRDAPVLIPPIDRHGWAADTRLTPRSVTEVMAARQDPAAALAAADDLADPPPSRVPDGWAWTPQTRQEIVEVLDDVDSRLDDLIRRSAALLQDTAADTTAERKV